MSKWQTTPFYCVLENALHTKITSMFYGFYMKFNHSKDVENEVYIVYKVSKQTFGFAHLIARIINICWLRETESLRKGIFWHLPLINGTITIVFLNLDFDGLCFIKIKSKLVFDVHIMVMKKPKIRKIKIIMGTMLSE